MVDFLKIFWDHEGHAHTNALHLEGFPHLLWESLQLFSYTEPPQYDAVEYSEEGVSQCKVKMTIPHHPSRSLWQPIEIDVVGHCLADTFEAAALEAINIFCDSIQMKLSGILLVCFLQQILVTPSGLSEYHTLDTY
jgi:hypothetical protein